MGDVTESAAGVACDGVVKWFRIDKGYGFVALRDGLGDAFLHLKSLKAVGGKSAAPGAKVSVVVEQGARGMLVTRIVDIDETCAPATVSGGFRRGERDLSSAVDLTGTVKWFDDAGASASSPATITAGTCSSIARFSAPPAFRASTRARRCRCGSSRRRKGGKRSSIAMTNGSGFRSAHSSIVPTRVWTVPPLTLHGGEERHPIRIGNAHPRSGGGDHAKRGGGGSRNKRPIACVPGLDRRRGRGE